MTVFWDVEQLEFIALMMVAVSTSETSATFVSDYMVQYPRRVIFTYLFHFIVNMPVTTKCFISILFSPTTLDLMSIIAGRN
jgi:hypothetical protein